MTVRAGATLGGLAEGGSVRRRSGASPSPARAIQANTESTVTVDSVFAWMERAGLGGAPLRLRTLPPPSGNPPRPAMQSA